jgi:hypothetical protein
MIAFRDKFLKIEGESAYGVVNVGTDHETFTTAINTVVDGNDVAGLFIEGRAK